MDDYIISGLSAFRYYRTPPRILAFYDGLPIARDRATRRHIAETSFAKDVLDIPIDTLVEDKVTRCGSKNIRYQLWTGPIPAGAIIETEDHGTITSPIMTLLILTRQLSVVQLAMAIYEMCGCFSVYKPTKRTQEVLEQTNLSQMDTDYDGWKQVISSDGKSTNLWQRPPLLTLSELKRFVLENKGIRGIAQLQDAMKMVTGVTRSPFEAQAAILLSAPRTRGGYGFAVETDKKITLTRAARKLSNRNYCFADLYIESSDAQHAVVVECQGAMVHAGEKAAVSDAGRTTALEAMGLDVILLTYDHIFYRENLEAVAKLISQKLNVKMAPRTSRMLEAERRLRHDLFIDWATLGMPTNRKLKNRSSERHNPKFISSQI